jgi:hypothetical protein
MGPGSWTPTKNAVFRGPAGVELLHQNLKFVVESYLQATTRVGLRERGNLHMERKMKYSQMLNHQSVQPFISDGTGNET